jgi:hypothetical protein
VRWFGKTWGAPVNEGEHADTPVGMFCASGCGERIVADDRGVLLPMAFARGQTAWDEKQVKWPDAQWYGRFPECGYHIDCFLNSVIPDGSPSLGELRVIVDVSRKP